MLPIFVDARELARRVRSTLRKANDALLEKRAVAVRKASRATFIGITGSSGKSTTTRLLSAILAVQGRVATQPAGTTHYGLVRMLSGMRESDYAVAELGTAGIGHIAKMTHLLRPDVAIVTLVALEHKSAFRSVEAVAEEKSALVTALEPAGIAVLNADDPRVMAMAERTEGRIVTFGLGEGAQYRAVDVKAAYPERLSFTAIWPGGSAHLRTRFIGEHFWLPVMAAVAAAVELGLPPDTIAETVAGFDPVSTRCSLIEVPGGPSFVLDTLKAPLHSLGLAFDVMANATASRRRIVLGHISDMKGANTIKYAAAYAHARASSDEVIFVGNHSHRSRASKEDVETGRFRAFATTEDAARYIRETAQPGELILLKGSVDLHLERIALDWQQEVRCWAIDCGIKRDCGNCGLYTVPYQQHRAVKRARRAWYRRILRRTPRLTERG